MTQRERCLRAIHWGYRTSREVSAATGIRQCSVILSQLCSQGMIEQTGILQYPAETQVWQFYEPTRGPRIPTLDREPEFKPKEN